MPEPKPGCSVSARRQHLPANRPGKGNSVAEWEAAAGAPGRPARGNLKVVTTNLRPGYVRKNGAPYSKNTVVTEYYDLNTPAQRRSMADRDHES